MDETAKLLTAQDYLRLTFGGNPVDTVGLKRLIDKIAESAFESVTIKGDSFEGKSHHGEIVFERALYLRAALDVFRELDPSAFCNQPVAGALTSFARTFVGT